MKPREIDMLHGPVAGKLLLFAVPLMLTSMMQLLFNAADTIVVGRFAGPEYLAGVGATNSLVNLYVNFLLGISVGANVLVAHELGAGNMKRAGLGVHTGVLTAFAMGAILAALGFFLAGPTLQLMQTPADVIGYSELYLRIYFLGVPFQSVYNVCAAILRANGDTRRPMVFLSVSGVLNVCLNLLFVILFQMNVAGVAIATVISQAVSMLLILRCLMKEKGPLRLSLKELRADKRSIMQIMHIGLPSGIQSALFSLSNIVIQSTVNSYGSMVVAGNSAAQGMEAFVYVSMNAFSQASQTFVSQNYGARAFDRVERVRRGCLFWALVFGLALGNLAAFLSPMLCGIYTTEAAAIQAGSVRMWYVCSLYCLCGMMEVMVGALRGIGHAVVPMITSLLGACAFRLLWIAFVYPLSPSIEIVYLSYPVSWFVTVAAHRIYWHFAWAKAKNLPM